MELHYRKQTVIVKGVGGKFSRGGRKKGGEGATEKDQKIAKKTENSTFKPLSTIFVSCMKIQGKGHGPLAPRCRRPWLLWYASKEYDCKMFSETFFLNDIYTNTV